MYDDYSWSNGLNENDQMGPGDPFAQQKDIPTFAPPAIRPPPVGQNNNWEMLSAGLVNPTFDPFPGNGDGTPPPPPISYTPPPRGDNPLVGNQDPTYTGAPPPVQPPPGNTTDNSFSFPDDKLNWSYQGLGPDFKNLLTQLFPQIQQAFTDYPQQQEQMFTQAREDIGKGYGDARGHLSNMFQNSLQPALQKELNRLGGRNMINSSVASDTLSRTATDLSSRTQDKMAAMGLEEQKALANLQAQQAGQQSDYPGLLTNLLNTGRYSEAKDEWSPYRDYGNFVLNASD